MTTYTAIPNTDIDGNSPGTQTLFTLIRDNPIAITEGAAGAPKIQAAAYTAGSVDTPAIAASAIGRSQIANSVATSAGSITNNTGLSINFNNWALFPMIHAAGGVLAVHGSDADGGTASFPRLRLENNSGGSATYDVDHRWILAA